MGINITMDMSPEAVERRAAREAFKLWKTSALQDGKITFEELDNAFSIPNVFNHPSIIEDITDLHDEFGGEVVEVVDDEDVKEEPTPEGKFGTQITNIGDDIMQADTGGIATFAPSSRGVGALLSDVDWASVSANATIGYDASTQQLMVIWDASSSGTGNAFVYSFRTQNWYKMTDAASQAVNMSNFANGRNNIVYVGGDSAANNVSKLSDRTGTTTIDIKTGDLFLENVESVKNLTRIAVTYKGGTPTSVVLSVAVNGTEAFTTVGTLDSTSTSYVTETFSLTTNSAFKTKKSFQIRLNGTAASTFEIQDISLVYRNLGVRV